MYRHFGLFNCLLKSHVLTKTFKRFVGTFHPSFDINKLVLYQDEDFIVLNKQYGCSTFGESEKKESLKKYLSSLLQLQHSEKDWESWNPIKTKQEHLSTHLSKHLSKHEANILYKLHNSVTGCVLICTNKFLKNVKFENEFVAIVYGNVVKDKRNIKTIKEKTQQIQNGKVKEKEEKEEKEEKYKHINGEIKLHLKYLPNSNLMIPSSNDYENIHQLKTLKYSVLFPISYMQHEFTFLKIYINAKNCKYIKPLLFYGLCTCIVGDNEYINFYKKLKGDLFFAFSKNETNISNLKRNKTFLTRLLRHMMVKDEDENKGVKEKGIVEAQLAEKEVKGKNEVNKRNIQIEKIEKEKEKEKQDKKNSKDYRNQINEELKLHLHCCKVIFESSYQKMISVSCELPHHFKQTFCLLQLESFKKNAENKMSVKSNTWTQNGQMWTQNGQMESGKKNAQTGKEETNIKKHIENENNNENKKDKGIDKDINKDKDKDSENENENVLYNCIHTTDLSDYTFYDSVQDEENEEKEEEEEEEEEKEKLLNKTFAEITKKKKKEGKKRGVLSKPINKMTKSDAPIFFTDAD